MTAITSSDCESIAIDSEYFLSDNQENLLTVTHNGTTVYDLVLGATILDYTLDNVSLGLTAGTLADGVYALTLTTTALNGDINTESICAAVLCGLHCDLVELYTDVNNAEKILAYEALKIAQGCVTCNCDTMLILYNVLINVVSNGCGCE